MRGIGRTLSRLPAARAFIAGAALLAGVAAPAAQAQAQDKGKLTAHAANETAYAVPRTAPAGSGAEVALPRPLSPSVAAQIRHIFALQSHGSLAAAAQLTSRLRDHLLLGPILADLYLGPYHHSTVSELTAWLARYGDQPDAPAIRHLLRLRAPRGAKLPPKPHLALLAPPRPLAAPAADPPRSDIGFNRSPWLDGQVSRLDWAGNTGAALNAIQAASISHAYGASLRGEVAQTLFTRGNDAAALAVAAAAEQEANGRVGLPGYIAGLAAWRSGHPGRALPFFRRAAKARDAAPGLRSAAAFWAARAALRVHRPAAYVPWMQRAARDSTGFYGLLARHLLGLDDGLAGLKHQTLGLADVDAVDATPQGHRAFALLQVGQAGRADVELRTLWPAARDNPALKRALMLVAAHAGLVDLASQIAMKSAGGQGDTFAVLTLPALHPRGGFRIDPALMYALARLESNFNAGAMSGAGAMGLMQLMPGTANLMARESGIAASGVWGLRDPSTNLALGQHYVAYLAGQPKIDNDLIRILASYNAGPFAAASWRTTAADRKDPLLYMEAIPNQETRRFVRRVLAYSWVYAAQMHLPAHSLDAMAEGRFPRFVPYNGSTSVADAAPILH